MATRKTVRKATAKRTPSKKASTRKAPLDGSAEVDAYMRKLKHPLKAEMAAVRDIIRKSSSQLAERIKWNAPSFYYKHDPKKDMLAFNPRADSVMLVFVFYDGAMIDDPTGLLEGEYKDRRLAKFHTMAEVKARKGTLTRVVKQWVKLVEHE